jgi:hypothetical protein
MSVNREKPHFLLVPEDNANRQIANGFFMIEPFSKSNSQTLPEQRGWPSIRDSFPSDYNRRLQRYPECVMILLVDFDNEDEADRIAEVKQHVDSSVIDRVFVLGAKSEPEELKKTLGKLRTYEEIGKALAKDCAEGTTNTWNHPLLAHNQHELTRMQSHIAKIFSSS